MLGYIVISILASLIAVYLAHAAFEYAKSQLSEKRRKNVLDIYTKKYQDIIRDQFEIRPPPVAPAPTPPEPDDADDMLRELEAFVLETEIQQN
jgi:non-homologous end joining protein Ku